jgi:uncharacterized protein YndB with AHSA1/START domain
VTGLAHQLDRTIVIGAAPAVVFRYFTDPVRWAAWWGAGSTIDPRPGGRVFVRYPNGVEALGEVVEIDAPSRIVFTYGYAAGTPVPPGASRVTIRLEPAPQGTRLHLVHELADAATRDAHVQGWRYQLSVFANLVADDQHGDGGRLVDEWFAAWNADDATRRASLEAIGASDLRLQDRYSCVEGREEVALHVAAAHKFMPGLRLEREGPARHCQGMVLANWTATGPDGQPRARGTNVFVLGVDGKIEAITGFWH